jgi:alkylhydroperoxidase family enzyme
VTDAPRVAPLPRDEWDDDAIAAVRMGFGEGRAGRVLATGPDAMRVPNVVGTLLHHPGLAGAFLAFNNVLLTAPTLEPRLRELMVLRVAWRTRSTYEWLQHVRLATERFDVTTEEIEAIGIGTDAEVWSELETDLLAATDQLLDGYQIDDDTWRRLAEHLDERQLVEVVFTVGTYTCLAMAFKSLGVQLDPDLETVTAPALPRG